LKSFAAVAFVDQNVGKEPAYGASADQERAAYRFQIGALARFDVAVRLPFANLPPADDQTLTLSREEPWVHALMAPQRFIAQGPRKLPDNLAGELAKTALDVNPSNAVLKDVRERLRPQWFA
ncbi:MAG: hypothetical protein M3P18_21245, partial [Actinomycetota bacterium]|nr:hypothetical protein [Actinomycetota bacterium]